jgi:tRNA dimethylallyltransferase
LSLFQRVKPARARLRFTTILFAPERASLTAAIDARCARMLDAGALAELRRLLALNLDPALPAMKALGVRELATLLDRDGDREVALERFRRATRQYAKRQTTWFRHQLTADLTLGAQFSESLKDDLFHFVRKTIDLGPRRQ